jgi:hypothetical protein
MFNKVEVTSSNLSLPFEVTGWLLRLIAEIFKDDKIFKRVKVPSPQCFSLNPKLSFDALEMSCMTLESIFETLETIF